MTRLPTWPVRLATLLCEWQARPFERGVTDCGTLAAAVIDACCGTAYLPALSGRYHDLRSAFRWIRQRGARTMADVAEVLTSNARIVPDAATIGDLLWHDDEPPIGHLAVHYGAYACAVGPRGLLYRPLTFRPVACCIPVGAPWA